MFRIIALSLITTMCSAQMPIAAPAPSGAQPSPVLPANTVTVPQGTQIPLTLVSSIRSKSTMPGDTIRAMVAFPMTVGTQIAIPAGTYVEGVVVALRPGGQAPNVQLHFTRLLFANGYSAALDAANLQAMLIGPEPALGVPTSDGLADARDGAPYLGEGFSGAGQTTPGLPPLPREGPNPVVVGAAVGGGMLALMVLLFTLGHHRMANTDYVLYQSGWQFQMVLDQPLTLDAAQVSAAAATASTN